MADEPAVRWRVTLTCRRPPRRPRYVNDTWHIAPHRLLDALHVFLTGDWTIVLTPRRVKVAGTLVLKKEDWNPRGVPPQQMALPGNFLQHLVDSLAHTLNLSMFHLDGPDPGELPGPLRFEIQQLSDKDPV